MDDVIFEEFKGTGNMDFSSTGSCQTERIFLLLIFRLRAHAVKICSLTDYAAENMVLRNI